VTIVEYEVRGSHIAYFTDDVGRSVFVYPIDRFATLGEVEIEISKSLLYEAQRHSKSKHVKILKDLKDKGLKKKVRP